MRHSRTKRVGAALVTLGTVILIGGIVAAAPAHASVGLGTATSFAVLGGSGVTNTGPTVVTGDLGSCPTPAISGFPPGIVGGTIHANDAVACGAQDDTTIAYNDAAGRAPTTTYAGPTDLGGLTLVGGVYKSPASFAITGTLTLDGQNDPDASFIFQAGSTVITATNSSVSMINGANPCNVFWQVGSSATLGVGSTLVGTVMALTSIAANTNAIVQGRLLARNGAVTLDSNQVTRPTCASTTTTSGAGGPTTAAPGGPTTAVPGGPTTTTSSTTPGGLAATTTTPSTSTTRPDFAVTDPTPGATATTAAVSTATTTAASAAASSATTAVRGQRLAGTGSATTPWLVTIGGLLILGGFALRRTSAG